MDFQVVSWLLILAGTSWLTCDSTLFLPPRSAISRNGRFPTDEILRLRERLNSHRNRIAQTTKRVEKTSNFKPIQETTTMAKTTLADNKKTFLGEHSTAPLATSRKFSTMQAETTPTTPHISMPVGFTQPRDAATNKTLDVIIQELITSLREIKSELTMQVNETKTLREILSTCDFCRKKTQCENTEEGHRCSTCPPGYVGDGTKSGCRPEIITCNARPCFPGVLCEDTNAGFVCGSCPTGYTGNGTHCDDIDKEDNGNVHTSGVYEVNQGSDGDDLIDNIENINRGPPTVEIKKIPTDDFMLQEPFESKNGMSLEEGDYAEN